MNACVCIHACMHACMDGWIYGWMDVNMDRIYTCIHTCVCSYISYMYTCISHRCIYAYIEMYACPTQLYTPPRLKPRPYTRPPPTSVCRRVRGAPPRCSAGSCRRASAGWGLPGFGRNNYQYLLGPICLWNLGFRLWGTSGPRVLPRLRALSLLDSSLAEALTA